MADDRRLWFLRDASFNATGRASGRGPTVYHLSHPDDAGRAWCRPTGRRRILLLEDGGEEQPPIERRCRGCARRVDQRPGALLRASWGRRERAVVYHGLKTCGGLLAYAFEHVPIHGRPLLAELAARGYDLTTLRFQIARRTDA